MIARHWRGWTTIANAEAYEHLLQETALPQLRQIEGYRGGSVLRNDGADEAEFVVINLFASLDAAVRFAGSDSTRAVFEPEAMRLLSRRDAIAVHYEARASNFEAQKRKRKNPLPFCRT